MCRKVVILFIWLSIHHQKHLNIGSLQEYCSHPLLLFQCIEANRNLNYFQDVGGEQAWAEWCWRRDFGSSSHEEILPHDSFHLSFLEHNFAALLLARVQPATLRAWGAQLFWAATRGGRHIRLSAQHVALQHGECYNSGQRFTSVASTWQRSLCFLCLLGSCWQKGARQNHWRRTLCSHTQARLPSVVRGPRIFLGGTHQPLFHQHESKWDT